MFVWFTLVAFPLIILSGMYATDFASVALARDEAKSLADAAATAGAWQIIPGTATIDCGTGAEQAQTVARTFVNSNASPDGFNTFRSAQLVGSPAVSCTSSSVTVTVNYTQPASAFYRALAGIFAGGTSAPVSSVSRTAIVCIPGSAPTVNSSCTRPQNG